MKPMLLAFLGMLLYATSGVLIEQKLSKFSIVALLLMYVAPMTVIAIVWLIVQNRIGTVQIPSGNLFWLAMFLGIMYFAADYFYLGAYTLGGNAIVISTIAIMAPVVTTIVRHFWVGGWPNSYQVAGYVLAAAAVILLAKGGTMAGV